MAVGNGDGAGAEAAACTVEKTEGHGEDVGSQVARQTGIVDAFPRNSVMDVSGRGAEALGDEMEARMVAIARVCQSGAPSAAAPAGAPPPTELAPELLPSAWSSLEKAVHDEIEKGGHFDMRGTVGQVWSKAKAGDKQLEADYKAVGKSYSAQREFRKKWLALKAEQLREERMTTEKHSTTDLTIGTYEPVAVVADKEKSVRAAAVYAWKCCLFFSQGKTLGGKPF
eukprot:2776708-Pyramimonas_sp.AAC.2